MLENCVSGGLPVYFESQTKICFEKIKASSKFGRKNLGFGKTRFGKASDEQIITCP